MFFMKEVFPPNATWILITVGMESGPYETLDLEFDADFESDLLHNQRDMYAGITLCFHSRSCIIIANAITKPISTVISSDVICCCGFIK